MTEARVHYDESGKPYLVAIPNTPWGHDNAEAAVRFGLLIDFPDLMLGPRTEVITHKDPLGYTSYYMVIPRD